MGGERASTIRQRQQGKTCWRCGRLTDPPYPHPPRERECRTCETANRTHRVYMRFERALGQWRVSLRSLTGNDTLRDFTFADADKVESMAERGGGLRDLAAKQGLEVALRSGLGGIELRLSDEQYRKLQQPRR